MATDVQVFFDASEQSTAAVVYIWVIDETGANLWGCYMRKSTKGHTVRRLEFRESIHAAKVADSRSNLELSEYSIDRFYYFTASRIALGYISNSFQSRIIWIFDRSILLPHGQQNRPGIYFKQFPKVQYVYNILRGKDSQDYLIRSVVSCINQ